MKFRLRRSLILAILLGSLFGETLRAQIPTTAPPIVELPATTQTPAEANNSGDPLVVVPNHVDPLMPWWSELVKQPLDPSKSALPIELEASVLGVLTFSPQVRVAADLPVVRQTQIADAASRFDPRAFVDSKFTDTSDPVGNLLTTGGASRFIDQTYTTSGGIRKTNTFGGQFEAAQKVGYQNNNSNFFIPKNQATSRITLTYTQPLLNGSGRFYNTSVICLAELNTEAASAELMHELQDIIMSTHRAYWDLRLQRAALLQRIRLKQSAIDIQNELRGRADFDVLQSQIVRADAAVATRDAAVIRFTTEVANAETRLRALINDPLLMAQPLELLPTMSPYHEAAEPDLVGALTTALQNRPEVKRGFTEVRAAGVRADVSKNELLPVFNVLLGTYVYGLQGSSQIGDAWVNQFDRGRPTYWTGLEFEYPLYNRGANARLTQRRVELRQVTNRLQQTMVQVRAETETSVREVTTTYREMVSRFHAMHADRTEIEYLTSRWRLAADDQQLAGVVLNDLLGAQERLAQAEYDFAAAEAAYNVALANLNAVTGTLLQAEGVQIHEAMIEGLPTLDIRSEAPPQPAQPAVPSHDAVPFRQGAPVQEQFTTPPMQAPSAPHVVGAGISPASAAPAPVASLSGIILVPQDPAGSARQPSASVPQMILLPPTAERDTHGRNR